MKSIFPFAFLILMALIIAVASCKKDSPAVSTLVVKLKDAPAVYQEVNIEVTGVQIHSDINGWVTVPVQTAIYNILLLKDSVNTTLGIAQIPTGKISQVRLILGSNNSVKANGIIYPLSLSSEDESGLKLNIHQELAVGITYTLIMDFDADKSISDQGNNTYKLKPVVSASFI